MTSAWSKTWGSISNFSTLWSVNSCIYLYFNTLSGITLLDKLQLHISTQLINKPKMQVQKEVKSKQKKMLLHYLIVSEWILCTAITSTNNRFN